MKKAGKKEASCCEPEPDDSLDGVTPQEKKTCVQPLEEGQKDKGKAIEKNKAEKEATTSTASTNTSSRSAVVANKKPATTTMQPSPTASSSALIALPTSSSSSARQSLCRKVRATVLDIIVPIGKRKRSSSSSSLLPTKTSFVFTEDDALRRVVQRMLRDCPKMCAQEDREGFLVKIMEIMDSEQGGAVVTSSG